MKDDKIALCIKPGSGNNPCIFCFDWTEETQEDFVICLEGTNDPVCYSCAEEYSPQLVKAMPLLLKRPLK